STSSLNSQPLTLNFSMGRYTGPKTKVSRRYGVPIFGSSKALERKNYPPGMHGPKGSRRKQSEYAIALGEKQKLRYQYGLLERQFRRIFQNALRKRGVTGETLLQLLETRIDNVVYRLGLANNSDAREHGLRRANFSPDASVERTLHTDTRFVEHVRVNHRRGNVLVSK